MVSKPDDAVAAVGLHDPDVLVTDVDFPSGDGLGAIRRLAEHHPGTKVVVVTDVDSPELVREALDLGVAGYTRKDRGLTDIGDVVERAARGEVAVDSSLLRRLVTRTRARRSMSPESLHRTLTPREQRVLELLVEGLNTAEIVQRLGISDSTARTHVQSILSKLGVHSRLQAVALMHRQVRDSGQRPAAGAVMSGILA